MKRLYLISLGILIYSLSFSQGIIEKSLKEQGINDIYCGSNFLMKHINHQQEGFMKASNEMMQELSYNANNYRTDRGDSVYIIPVVFHIVYNNDEENLPDSVIYNQIDLLNEMYRRQNADTSSLREEFKNLVGDAKIEFRLADTDPDGNPTNGIIRTETTIEDFGGIMPYGQNETAKIQKWVQDSLMLNYARLSSDEQGGSSPWDKERYLNIWTGDLRIWEPAFNVEEIVFLAFATPPIPHPNWPEELVSAFTDFNQGAYVHYLNIGNNNPNSYMPPYQAFNGLVNKGKTLVHEIGHYLGLRHIWGDGDCSMDDYIEDTPNATSQSQFDCNSYLNTCVDDINGEDLPNMIENYMDYSSSDCQNSFTLGQIGVMNQVLKDYRPLLAKKAFSTTSVNTLNKEQQLFRLAPNPTSNQVKVHIPKSVNQFNISLFDNKGMVLMTKNYSNTSNISLELPYKGLFLIKINYNNHQEVHKVIKY